MSPEKLIRYTRDALCVPVGLGGIVFQIYTGRPSALGMSTCITLLAIAGGYNVKLLLPPTRTRPRGGRERSSSSSRSGSRSRSTPPSEGDE